MGFAGVVMMATGAMLLVWIWGSPFAMLSDGVSAASPFDVPKP